MNKFSTVFKGLGCGTGDFASHPLLVIIPFLPPTYREPFYYALVEFYGKLLAAYSG